MIGLDTNVLVRYIADDDPVQSPKARTVIQALTQADPAWICQASLLELVWLLDRKIKVDRAGISTVLRTLTDKKELEIENRREVVEALELYQRCRANYSDCLIAVVAQTAGCSKVVTFDRIAARAAGMELIP